MFFFFRLFNLENIVVYSMLLLNMLVIHAISFYSKEKERFLNDSIIKVPFKSYYSLEGLTCFCNKYRQKIN